MRTAWESRGFGTGTGIVEFAGGIRRAQYLHAQIQNAGIVALWGAGDRPLAVFASDLPRVLEVCKAAGPTPKPYPISEREQHALHVTLRADWREDFHTDG